MQPDVLPGGPPLPGSLRQHLTHLPAPHSWSLLGRGASCAVWQLRSGRGAYVLRLAQQPGGVRFLADALVRERLAVQGARVARPAAQGLSEQGLPWCLDEFVEGHPVARGALPPAACRDLGALLSRQHALPVRGYGLLLDTRDHLQGGARDALAGLLTRWPEPWPLATPDLHAHPLARAAPELLGPLQARRGPILELLERGEQALVHGDLHEQQLLLHEGRLAALLDYGDAMVASPSWDVASFAYFHGLEPTREVLAGYSRDERVRARREREARLLVVVIALHQLARGVRQRQSRRVAFALSRLRSLVPGS